MPQRRVVYALFAFLLSLSAAASADSRVRIVRLSYLDGNVQIDRNTGQGFEKALTNMPVIERTLLATEDGRAEVEFENGSTLRLIPDSRVHFRELSLRYSGDKVSLLELSQGTAYFDIKREDDDEFRIVLPEEEIRLDKSARFRVSIGPSETTVAVFKGQVEVVGVRTVRVRKNETLTLDRDDRDRYFLAKGTQELPYDEWDKRREDYQDRYARVSYGRSQYLYGFNDLNYYGSYFHHPSYGYMWRPYSVGLSWNPFHDGAWAWYPGAGWVFVSTQPWGWTPYRSGQWHYLSGYGWCWQPARHWNTWYAVPAVRTAPPRFTPPSPPAGGGPGSVIVRTQPSPDPRHRPRNADDWDDIHGRGRFRDRDADFRRGVPRQIPGAAAVTNPSAVAPAPTAAPPSGEASRIAPGRGMENRNRDRDDRLRDREFRGGRPGTPPAPRAERVAPVPPRMQPPATRVNAPPRMEAPRSMPAPAPPPRMEAPAPRPAPASDAPRQSGGGRRGDPR